MSHPVIVERTGIKVALKNNTNAVHPPRDKFSNDKKEEVS